MHKVQYMNTIREKRRIVENFVDDLSGLYVLFGHYNVYSADFRAQVPNVSYRLKELRAVELQLRGIFKGQEAHQAFRSVDAAIERAERIVAGEQYDDETNAACAEGPWKCRGEARGLLENPRQAKLPVHAIG